MPVAWPTSEQTRGRPLEGVKVLDVSRILAGPYCTMLLADLGADVIKVEPPRGDETRRWGPPFVHGDATYYFAANRNKRGIELDLSDPSDRAAFDGLVRQADVLLHNYTSSVAAKLQLDASSVHRLNDKILYANISGFGSWEPDRPGYDLMIQALGGIMAVTGPAGGTPSKVGVAIVDIAAGLFTALGIVAGLRTPDRSGIRLEVSLYDTVLALLTNQAMSALAADVEPGRLGNDHPNVCPYGAYQAADRVIVLAVATDGHFARLCSVLGIADAATDTRFLRNSERVRNRDALKAVLEAALARRPAAQWSALLDDAGVPNAAVRSVTEALRSPEAHSVTTIDHAVYGAVPQIRSPLRFDGEYLEPYLAPPRLDEHRADIMGKTRAATSGDLLSSTDLDPGDDDSDGRG